MIKRIFQKMTLLFLAVLFLPSCSDFLDVDTRHAANEGQQWKTLEDTRAALMGVYGLMRAALAENNTYWVCGDVRMGDFTVYNREELKFVANNELSRSSKLLDEVSDWNRFYRVVNAASLFIEKAPRAQAADKSYSEANLVYDMAQARAIRAFAYFYMVRMWGDVPLVTQSYDNGSFPKMARTDARTVLSYAKAELLETVKKLPYGYGRDNDKYYGKVAGDWRGLLLNKLSAYAILAHISAWEGNYIDAETYAAFVQDNASQINAQLLPVQDLTSSNGFFSHNSTLNGSKIVAFSFLFSENEATSTGHLESLTLAEPLIRKTYPDIYVSKDSLYSIFDNLDDVRFGIDDTLTNTYYTNYIYNMNAKVPMFSKIKVIQNGSPKTGNYAIFGSSLVFSRLEEIILLRAEALAAMNRFEDALIQLNSIRAIRNLPTLSFKKSFGSDGHKLIKAIFQERRRELMGEGWRWYDQIRCQKLLRDDSVFLQLIEDGGIYWPVAKDVLSANSLIKQNDYWVVNHN